MRSNMFRFHTGSIKRQGVEKPCEKQKLMFRFHTGSIKSEIMHPSGVHTRIVSIPYWFD